MSGEPRFSHRECYFCGAEGYLFREARPAPGGLEASFVIEVKHEGWPGIPHGGVGMTSIVELANLFDESSTQFPWRADFRFGGERIVTSESVRAALSREGDLYRGIVEKNGEGQPYLVGTITRRRESALDGECGSLVRLLKQPVKNKASVRAHAAGFRDQGYEGRAQLYGQLPRRFEEIPAVHGNERHGKGFCSSGGAHHHAR